MKLIKYRDWGMSTHTYFWASEDDKILSPYFETQTDAEQWMAEQTEKFNGSNRENN